MVNVLAMSWESLFWRMPVCFFGSVFWFSLLVYGCAFLLPMAIKRGQE